MPNVGPVELIVVLLIVLVVVGPKKLPGLGKSLGTGMREFKDSISGDKKDDGDDYLAIKQREAQAANPPAVQPAPPVAEPAPLTKEPTDRPAPPHSGSE